MYGESDMETYITICKIDQIGRSVMSDSLRPHESQHARPPCPSLKYTHNKKLRKEKVPHLPTFGK